MTLKKTHSARNVIRQHRGLKNFSQEYAAAQTGISQNACSKIANNLANLTVHHGKQLSEILQVPMSGLPKDEFEIHRPFSPSHKAAHKEEVIKPLDLVRKTLLTIHAARHDAQLISMS